MNELNGFTITKRDRVLRGWQVSTGLVREYMEYAREVEKEDLELSELFVSLSENEAKISSQLLDILEKYENSSNHL
jgi:hypothetical protein